MIEVSITEILLFIWATAATGYAYKCKADKHMVTDILHRVIENVDVYTSARNSWLDHKKKFVKN